MQIKKGVIHWPKHTNFPLSTYFQSREFECPCQFPTCDTQFVEWQLINKLTNIRHKLGKPIRVSSGYRCDAYQAHLTSLGFETSLNISQHTKGAAADIEPVKATPADMSTLQLLCEEEFKSIGIALSFLHVDLRDDKPKRRWYYTTRR